MTIAHTPKTDPESLERRIAKCLDEGPYKTKNEVLAAALDALECQVQLKLAQDISERYDDTLRELSK